MAGLDAFEQDPLRLLRAFRLSAQLGLTLDPETGKAVKRRAASILRSAPERIHYEWSVLLSQPHSFGSLNQMDETGLFQILFPEMGRLKGVEQDRYHHLDVFRHSLLTLQCLEEVIQNKFPLPADLEREMSSCFVQERKKAWLKEAALFHDLGKSTTMSEKGGHRTFYGHAEASLDQFDSIARRFRLGNREKDFIRKIIGRHMRPLLLVQEDRKGRLTRRAITRFVREGADELNAHFLLALADSLAAQGKEKPIDLEERLKNLWREALSIREALIPPRGKNQAFFSGKDLIELGLKPGPLFKTLLSEIEEARLEGEVVNREEALNWVKKREAL